MNPGIDKHASDYDHEAFSISKRLISKRETTLLISPISGKRYIKSDDNQLFDPSYLLIYLTQNSDDQ